MGCEPFADATSLVVLRRRIDDLNRELIDALAEVAPRLSGPAVQQALPQRAEEILTGDGLAEVRETAITPCVANCGSQARRFLAPRLPPCLSNCKPPRLNRLPLLVRFPGPAL